MQHERRLTPRLPLDECDLLIAVSRRLREMEAAAIAKLQASQLGQLFEEHHDHTTHG